MIFARVFTCCFAPGEGIEQLLFLEGDEVCETSYADRKGKYQAQVGIVPPRVRSGRG